MSSENLSPGSIWNKTVDMVKDRVNNRALWEALEVSYGITIEDGIFIAGLPTHSFSQSGHINKSDHKNTIEKALSFISGQKLSLRLIEGVTLADWQAAKERDAALAKAKSATYQRRDREDATAQSWDSLGEQIQRAYSATPFRQLPQVKARFTSEWLTRLAEAMATLYPENPDEVTERQLAKVIDKLSGCADMPSSVIALELARIRARS